MQRPEILRASEPADHLQFRVIDALRACGMAVASSAGVTPDTRRQVATMLGEFMREAGVLIAVLAPLELLVTHGALTIRGVLAIVGIAVPCLVSGVILGLERQ